MKNLDLSKDKISKLLISFAIPCVISMLINSVYNIVDQIFIGKGVGTLGNAATNVIFPLVILCNALAGLIGNGAAANLSLKLGEKKEEEARKSIGQAITISIIVSVVFSVLAFIALPKLIYFFGCTKSVEEYALTYGRVILIGAPFMIMYTSLSSIIRSDGSPKYSMVLLVVGAIINLILDPLFIFTFHMGVLGGALATIIGQIVSFIIAILYIPKIKSVTLTKQDFKLDKNVFKILSLGVSSFITQGTVLALFVFMNNIMTKFGSKTEFGSDVPLSVYGVVSKINNLYVSSVLGISIGSQPIIGYNYGSGNLDRVKETIKKILIVNFIIGILFNIMFLFFPEQIVGIFVSNTDESYELFIKFGKILCQGFLMLSALNALEMTTSITIQSLGNVKKSTAVSFARQIILFIPLTLLFCIGFNKGIYAVTYSGPLADSLCFIFCIFILGSEYKKLSPKEEIQIEKEYKNKNYKGPKIVVTIAREYGSGGRYVGELLAKNLKINFYDKELISLAAKESGLSKTYIEEKDETKKETYENNNDDRLFIAESNVIKNLANTESCVIVGRCADYILKDNKEVIKIFLYSDDESKVKRAVNYYNLDSKNALKQIQKTNKQREKHYKYYTSREWKNPENYDIMLNVDYLGIEESVKVLTDYIKNKIK